MTRKTYRPKKKVRMNSVTEKLIVAGLILCCVVVLFLSTFVVLKSVGKNSLKKHAAEVANQELSAKLNDETENMENVDEPLELEEGQILVEGKVYEYNKDIMTFLCMGVDARSGIGKEKTPGKAGQADALLMVVVNPRKEDINVIAINRDTMTDIEIYDTAGMYLEEEKGQISVLANQEKQLLEKLNKVDELLANLYSLDVIYPKYRELIPVVTMLEYLESGRCDELTGANGAYNIYESEVRQNIIISSLGRVISMLGSIRDNQYALYQVLQHSNSLVEGMSSEIEKLAESNYAIAKNSKTAAYYSQIAADSTKISAYIDSCNFRGIKYI